MLIKCTIDDTVSFLGGASVQGNALVMWIVQEHLPLEAPAQLGALARAIGLDDPKKIDVKQLSFIVNNEQLDWSKNPVENKLMGGTIGTITSRSVTPRTARQERNGLSQTDFESSFSDLRSARSQSRVSGMPEDDDVASNGTTNNADEDEIYVAEECGWFPFKVENNYGQLPIGSFLDPTKPVGETDSHPHIQHLCTDCSLKMSQAEPLDINVDRHYKPMAVRTEVCDGWVEKLSLNMIARWQKRFLSVSEKSLDWFTEEPTGLKTKIRGTRKVVTDAACNIAEVIDAPDPVKYPKCKDVNYFHFGVTFIDPAQTVFFRVTSLQDRNRYILFLKSAKERASNSKGSRRNPVYWKKWADAFLTNLTDLGEVTIANDAEADALTRRLQELADKKAELLEEKPGLEAVISEKRDVVRRLATEIERVKVAKLTLEREAEDAENNIEGEKLSLIELEVGLGDEVRSAEMLRSHAASQRDDCELRVQTLLEEIEMLKERHHHTFLRWRKHEEANAAAIAFGKPINGGAGAGKRSKSVGGGGNVSKALSFSVDGVPLPAGARSLPPELQEASMRSRAGLYGGASTTLSAPGSFMLNGSITSFKRGGGGGVDPNNSTINDGHHLNNFLSPDAKNPIPSRAPSFNTNIVSSRTSQRGPASSSSPQQLSHVATSVPLGSPIFKRGSMRSRQDPSVYISPNSTGFNSPVSSPRNDGCLSGVGGMMSFNHSMGGDDDYMGMPSSMNGSITRHNQRTPASTNTNIDAIQGLIHHQAAIRRSLGLIKEQVAKRPSPRPTTNKNPSSSPTKDEAAAATTDTTVSTDTNTVAATEAAAAPPQSEGAKEDSAAGEEPQTARTPVESASNPTETPAASNQADAAPEK